MVTECPLCQSDQVVHEPKLSRTVERIDAVIEKHYYDCSECGARIRIEDRVDKPEFGGQGGERPRTTVRASGGPKSAGEDQVDAAVEGTSGGRKKR